jgi:hypothetical protein
MITNLIDECLTIAESHDALCLPGDLPDEMKTGRKEDDWEYWKPINSSVTDEDIEELEKQLNFTFSPQYRSLLKHKHFLELYIGEVSLLSHPIGDWKEVILKSAYKGYPREYLIDKGYFPFADFSDWGLWCFKIDEVNESGEYPIYLWDHDRPLEYKKVAGDIYSGLLEQKNNPLDD